MSLLFRVFFFENDNYLYLVNIRQWYLFFYLFKYLVELVLFGFVIRFYFSKGGGVVFVQYVEVVFGGDGQGQVLERFFGGRNLK